LGLFGEVLLVTGRVQLGRINCQDVFGKVG